MGICGPPPPPPPPPGPLGPDPPKPVIYIVVKNYCNMLTFIG